MFLDIYSVIGIITTVTFYFMKKEIKNKWLFRSFLIISFFLSFVRLFYIDKGNIVGYLKCDTADYLYSPLIYLLSFLILRMIFKEFYKREPSFNDSIFSNYDPKLKVFLNYSDYAVNFIPLIGSLLWPYLISRILH